MKVEVAKGFSPLTITIETPEEFDVLMKVLYMRLDNLGGYIWDYHDRERFLAKRADMYDMLDKIR